MMDWTDIEGFEWDAGNERKSQLKHAVSMAEAEQVFFHQPLVVAVDAQHSAKEARWHALGRSDAGRLLHVTFTLRARQLIRVISARDMHRRKGAFMRNTADKPRVVKLAAKALKPVPAFASEADERRYWESHDSTNHVDWSPAQRVRLPNLKPTSKSISLRLPLGLLEALRIEANRRDVPYQSLIKVWLSEKVDLEAST